MNYRPKLKQIKALIFDIDGVFSNEFLAFDNANLHRIMNQKDGFAIKYAKKKGFLIGIITGGSSESIRQRFELIGVTDIYINSKIKLNSLKDFCEKYQITFDEVLYMGDDLPDYQVMKNVGLAACPLDAANEILQISHYISDKKAGDGCVRDIVEQVMKIQEKWSVEDFIDKEF
jgi:3-deoxy-D-manno-octulosonate 8-phosphate phosphatase (KDO 8-P phosphatase)